MSAQVFLSYSHRDRVLASALGRELKKLGVSYFNPENIKAGADWRKAITEGIRKSDAMAVLLTEPNAAASSWIGYEIGYASGLRKDIVVLKPSSFSVADFPSDLAGWRIVDFDPARPDRAAKSLVSSLAIVA